MVGVALSILEGRKCREGVKIVAVWEFVLDWTDEVEGSDSRCDKGRQGTVEGHKSPRACTLTSSGTLAQRRLGNSTFPR